MDDELKMVDYGDVLFHPGNLWHHLDSFILMRTPMPQYEPPAGLTTMNVCMAANWCLELLMEGRRNAGL
jgi:hypothetical protein